MLVWLFLIIQITGKSSGEFSSHFCQNENDVGSCLARAEAAAAECSLLLFSHPVSWGYYKIPVCW